LIASAALAGGRGIAMLVTKLLDLVCVHRFSVLPFSHRSRRRERAQPFIFLAVFDAATILRSTMVAKLSGGKNADARQRTAAQTRRRAHGREKISRLCQQRQEREREDLRAMKERREEIEQRLLARVAQLTGNVLR